MILLFSDIHADKKAAQEIERLAPHFTDIICCGDVCGYGKDNSYCIDMFKELNIKAVMGNHDYLIVNKRKNLRDYPREVSEPIKEARKWITEDELLFLSKLPESITFGDFYITHTFDRYYYIRTEEDCRLLTGITDKKNILIGHTHEQAEFNIDGVRIINPGSITRGRRNTKRGYVVLDGDSVEFITCDEEII